MEQKDQLQNKIFLIIVRIGIILSTLCIVGNIVFGFPFETNLKWMLFAAVSLAGLKLSFVQIVDRYFKFFYFLCVIILLIPYGWIDSGGSSNNTIAYTFLILMSVTFLFQDWERILLIVILVMIYEFLLILEHKYPGMIKVHNNTSQFYDRLVQIPITLTGGFLLLKQFATAYVDEKKKLNEYSTKLEAANKKLEFLAKRDELTGLYNRRASDEKITEIMQQKKSLKSDIWIILFDIDCFKSINDQYGHDIGDKAIQTLAATANTILPEQCFISRWGGDEFCIIYPGGEKELRSFIESFQTAVNLMVFHDKLKITVSIGASRMTADDSILSLFRNVDKALYQSKNNGRNQYTIINQ